ncbi:hypothetical protein DPMN_182999 [Dreissena polymorpha]|uniref:Uncharacterized protein n=1 Tax=Dreissena polymorpha TaxID=45954 RepID=A0A9D4I5Z4_DREPO|nr:hypothetical protein DPMN_182999 [Dreissena polymorpha]
MRTGILSATRKASTLRTSSSFSFVNKSVQEFLAAYYIACYSHVINEVIFGYLKRHENSYPDISAVLIFLCGLNISAANELSILMNNAASDCLDSLDIFQEIILDGYREEVANEQDDIRLALSYFNIKGDNIRDLHNIWASNTSVVRLFSMRLEDDIIERSTYVEDDYTESPKPDKHNSTSESSTIASRIEFDLSSCDKLTYILLNNESFGVWIKGNLCKE